MSVTKDEYDERVRLSLDEKVEWSVQVILEYYLHFKGQVYLTFSGGKDSQTVLEIINRMFSGEYKKYFKDIPYEYGLTEDNCLCYGEIPSLFADTGLEKPEIRKHAMSFERTIKARPRRKFDEVIKSEGVAIGSKSHARAIRELNWDYTDNNKVSRTVYLTGFTQGGRKTAKKLPKRYYKFINKDRVRDFDGINPDDFGTEPPFKVSEKCCDYFKKQPFKDYEKESGRKPITGTMAIESRMRSLSYLQTGCNSFDGKAMSRPLSIWTPEDVWAYAGINNIKFASCYYDQVIEYKGNAVPVEGSKREGCMFCLFGAEFEERDKKKGRIKFNRFEKLAITHPKQHKYLIEKLGFDVVCDAIGINHTPTEDQLKVWEQGEFDFMDDSNE